MTKRVLLAIDLGSPSTRAASYAVQLAARLKFSLVLMAVSPANGKRLKDSDIPLEELPKDQRAWLDRVVGESRREEVNLEIFISFNPFYEELLRFVESRAAIDFIIMGLPDDGPREGRGEPPHPLESIHSSFDGEVLLVRPRGEILRLSDHLNLTNPEKES